LRRPAGAALQHQRPRGARAQAGRELGRQRTGPGDGFRTLNLRFAHWKPAASGIFAVLVHGLAQSPLPGVANLGMRPSLDPTT
jgi:riboflavin kinase/FMN adenylyltransferase